MSFRKRTEQDSLFSKNLDIKDIFAVIDKFENSTEFLRNLESRKEQQKALVYIGDMVEQYISSFSKDDLIKFGIYYADKFYRITSKLAYLDEVSFSYLGAVSKNINSRLTENNVNIAYFIDNRIPSDRLQGTRAFFSSLGFLVFVFEEILVSLMKATGINTDDEDFSERSEQFIDEAVGIAFDLLEKTSQEKEHILFLSYSIDLPVYDHLLNSPNLLSYLRMFRNAVPEDGTTIQVFQPSEAARF